MDLMAVMQGTMSYSNPSRCPPALAGWCGSQARAIGVASKAYDTVRGALVTVFLCLCGVSFVAAAIAWRRFARAADAKKAADADAAAAAAAAANGGTPAPAAARRKITTTGGTLFWVFLALGVTGVLCGAYAGVSVVRGR